MVPQYKACLMTRFSSHSLSSSPLHLFSMCGQTPLWVSINRSRARRCGQLNDLAIFPFPAGNCVSLTYYIFLKISASPDKCALCVLERHRMSQPFVSQLIFPHPCQAAVLHIAIVSNVTMLTLGNAAGEDRAHDLRIMRPTRCQLRYCRSCLHLI
jgi:hypothetical protein